MGEELRPIQPLRKFVIDHHFFDVIDTEAKAYWLGFFTADGCVVNCRALTINLAAVDAGHLMKLNASLSSDYPVHPTTRGLSTNGMVRWHATSKPIVRAFGELGVTPRKSVVVQPWDGPADLMRHYWRGMVDGDGGLSFNKPKSRPGGQWRIFLTGSRACVEAFARWGSGICGSQAKPGPDVGPGKTGNCWHWVVGGNRITFRLVEELYGDCSISLDRKQARADAILGGNRDGLAA